MTDKEIKMLGRHDLAELWKLARPLIEEVCEAVAEGHLPSNDLEGIEAYIQQLHEHDPDGQRFRYATVKVKRVGEKRSRSLHPDLRHINIRIFATALEGLADYLDGVETWLDHLAVQKAEMLAEYARMSP